MPFIRTAAGHSNYTAMLKTHNTTFPHYVAEIVGMAEVGPYPRSPPPLYPDTLHVLVAAFASHSIQECIQLHCSARMGSRTRILCICSCTDWPTHNTTSRRAFDYVPLGQS